MSLRELLILSGLALVSCGTVGEDYERPEIQSADMKAWNGRLEGVITDADLDPQVLAEWWKTLDDPLLTSLIERATASNLDLRIADAQLRQARAQRKVADSQGMPNLGFGAGADRSGAGGQTGNFYSLGLDASWEIDLFGQDDRAVEAAVADQQASQEARRDVLVSVLAEVALNYVDLRTTQARLELMGKNVEALEQTVKIVEAKVAAGEVSRVEVDQATANLARTRSQVPALEQQLKQIKNRLALLMGSAPGTLDDELDPVEPLVVPPLSVALGVPAEVLRRRPDVRRSERVLAAETARLGVAVGDLYPVFSLGGTIGLESVSTSTLFDMASGVFGLGPRLQWNLFDGGRTRARIEAQDAVQEQALISYERTLLVALEDVQNAISAFAQEQLRHHSLAEAMEAAVSAEDLARTRFEAGGAPFLVVLDAQRTKLSAQDELAQSEGAITANLVRLYKALGGGWDPEDPNSE